MLTLNERLIKDLIYKFFSLAGSETLLSIILFVFFTEKIYLQLI